MRRKSAGNKLARNKSQHKILREKTLLGIHEETPILSERIFLGQIKIHRSTKLLGGLITFFVTFFALSSPISDVFREPDIQHSTAQVDDPFDVHFSLHNPSSILPMTDMRINCVLEKIRLEYNFSLVGIPIDDGVVTSIPAGNTIEYKCPVHKAFDDTGPIVHAKIKINATFRTLGYKRSIESELFNWDFVSRQWIKGEIIN